MDNGKTTERKQYSAEMKFKIIKEALTTDQQITEVCKKYGITTGVFYRWQEQFFSGAKDGLAHSNKGPSQAETRKILSQEQEIGRLKDVIAEITSENIGFKKKFSE